VANPNFDNIITTTLQKYWNENGRAVDNIYKRTPTLDFLKRRARLDSQGGRSAVAQIEFANNSTFQTYSGYDTLVPAVDEILTAAEFPWKQAAIYIPMSGIEEAKNSGDRAILALLKAKTENAERTAAEQFDSMFFTSDGTGNSGKDWAGLPYLVGDQASAITTVGGINATTDAYWRSKVVTGADTALTLAGLSNLYNSISRGSDTPDFQVTTQALYEKYEGLLQPNQRFMDPKTAEAGFTNLIYRGSTVVWGDNVPAKHWYMLNSRHIKMAVLSGSWMRFRGFVTPYNVDAKYGLVLNYGAFVVNERRALGVIKNAI
jgi:hypothetical protein